MPHVCEHAVALPNADHLPPGGHLDVAVVAVFLVVTVAAGVVDALAAAVVVQGPSVGSIAPPAAEN